MLNLNKIDTSYPNVGCTFLALVTLIMEVFVEEDENQIRGLDYIADFSGISAKQIMIFPLEDWYKFGKNSEVIFS